VGKIRILHLEDVPADAELVHERLRAAGIDCDIEVVSDEGRFVAALDAGNLELILSDHELRGFNGTQALRLAVQRRPEVPFVFVSGSIGEEFAIESLKGGATDYVLKERLSRLGPAVSRALREAEERASLRRAEAEVRERDRRLYQILENMDGVFYLLSPDVRKILYVNPAYETIWCRPRASLYARADDWMDAIHPDDKERVAKAFGGHPDRFDETYRILIPDGQSRWIRDRSFPVRSESGEVQGIAGFAEDITEQKVLQAQFLRAQRMESIGTLAGGIAHDLNNILAPILMAADMLKRRVDDEKSQKTLATIESSARRGADLVKQILTFARGVEGERLPLDPRQLLSDLEKIVRETFPKTIEMRYEVPDDLWNAPGDPTQLHQVLLNLLVNARDAMPDGGTLKVDAENVLMDENYCRMHLDAKPGAYVAIRVQDTGTGIPPALLEKIFEPFFSTKGVGKGTGLGLSTSLAIVKSHGGFINVYSERGKGTTFRICLPATPGESHPAVEGLHVEPPLGQGETILVVDDEASLREIAKETLEASGYHALTAADGSEAVVAYARSGSSIAAVLTDMKMPIMDGLATTRALKRIDPNVKVIITSGLGDSTDIPSEGGVPYEFLSKPYTAEKLLAAVGRVLSKG
jgi:two-component system cell cycle sensor histidine kinase/response regulator CckA